ATATEFEITRAVVHMANASGGSFEEPAAPAGGECESADKPAQAAAAPAPAPAAPAQAAAPAAAPAEKAEKPAAEAAPAEKADAAGGADLAKGKQIYEGTCAVCHGTGVANAPKLGDKERWAPLI